MKKEELKSKMKHTLHDLELPQKEQKPLSKKVAGIALVIISVLTCVLTVLGIWFLGKGGAFSEGGAVYRWIEEHYIIGALVMVLVCAVQVIVALVPGEVVEVSAGLLFGWWEGTLICIIGMTLGSIVVILLVRRFGRRFVEAFYRHCGLFCIWCFV